MVQLANYAVNSPLKPLSGLAQQIEPGTYEHYKKKQYEVIGVARQTETLEEVVVYLDDAGVLWARPVGMFSEEVQLEDGSIVPRFRRLDLD